MCNIQKSARFSVNINYYPYLYTMIKFNTPKNGHYIKAEISLYPNQDTFTIFDLMKDIVGYNHILINKEHYIVNTKTHQLIPCKNYSDAQDWCYKFTCPHLML